MTDTRQDTGTDTGAVKTERLNFLSDMYSVEEQARVQLKTAPDAAGDPETERLARSVQEEERAMMDRLETHFDRAEAASSGDADAEEVRKVIPAYLADAHALESQTIQFLERGHNMAHMPTTAHIYRDHLSESRLHKKQLERRLNQLDASSSFFKDMALTMGAFNWSLFFQAQSDTSMKLAVFVYALLHLEIGGYEMLLRTARRARDPETMGLCEGILAQERAMARRMEEAFPDALSATVRGAENAKD